MDWIQKIMDNAAELWAVILALGCLVMVLIITLMARKHKRRHPQSTEQAESTVSLHAQHRQKDR